MESFVTSYEDIRFLESVEIGIVSSHIFKVHKAHSFVYLLFYFSSIQFINSFYLFIIVLLLLFINVYNLFDLTSYNIIGSEFLLHSI